MSKEERIMESIDKIVSDLMDKVMDKVLKSDPFIAEKHRASKPLYAALVPDEIFKGSHFERRFVTPFGGVWEKLACAVAKEMHENCVTSHTITGCIPQKRLQRIQEILNSLEHRSDQKERLKPNWDEEIEYILKGDGHPIPVTVVCDLFIDSALTNKKYAFELKAPLPNSDQTKVSKEKMFKLLAMDPLIVDQAFYALPYNPYGKKENYAWSFPLRWFDMKSDSSVLIGDEFWDFIGGARTYKTFIQKINDLGKRYRNRIYREFLGIEPPSDIPENNLK